MAASEINLGKTHQVLYDASTRVSCVSGAAERPQPRADAALRAMAELVEKLPDIEGFCTENLEELTVKEAAYHTKTSRFYKLVAHTSRGT